MDKSPTVKHCIVVKRTGCEVKMKEGRDLWWHELMAEASADCPATPLDSENLLFILYTSGSTGKPKGIKHTTAGYNLFAKKTMEWVFDIRDEDVYWSTADIGWITGHTYVVYGPLTAGATTLMYEGSPDWPNQSRWWEMIERYKVNILYTAPTAIRTFIKWGDEWVDKHDLSSLRLLGTVGEGINPEAWMWYHRKIGGERCPIVDTWWQTETGGNHDDPFARRNSHQARQLHKTLARHSARNRGRRPQTGAGGRRRMVDHHASLGRPCYGASGATTSVTKFNTGPTCRINTCAATTPAATKTATTGSWAASTTC